MLASVVLTSASTFGIPPLGAQSPWTDRRADRILTFDVLKPEFDGPDDASFTTSVVMASVRVPVAARVFFVGELPFSHYGDDFNSDDAVGSPYAGVEVRSANGRTFGEFGVRLPTASDNSAALVGFFTDIDQWEAFVADVLPVSAAVNYRFKAPTGVVTRFRVGPTLWLDVGDNVTESELVLSYGYQLGYEGSAVSLMGGLSGRLVVTESDLDFGERTVQNLGVALTVGAGRVRPNVQLRIPLDEEVNDVLNAAVGLGLTVAMP